MSSEAGSTWQVAVPKPPRPGVASIVRQVQRRAREGHLSVARQLGEMLVLRLFYGIGPGYYLRARFWRRDLPWEFKTGFWPYRKFRRVVRRINPPAYQKLSQNKLSEKALLQQARLPTAAFVGSLHRHHGYSRDGRRLTCASELSAFLLTRPVGDRLCFKLLEGYGGKGFRAVETVMDGQLKFRLLDSGVVTSVAEFLSGALELEGGNGYLIEEYIEQHPALARLNPSSVNTLRVWACCSNGNTAVIDVFLRVGGRGSLVDNTSMGAQIFRVDRDSGTIGEGMARNIENTVFHSHRDSGERISGSKLPFWHEAMSLARRAVTLFPEIRFAGVDIAITAGGPVVVELNVEPDPSSAIVFDRSHRELLGAFKSAGGPGEI